MSAADVIGILSFALNVARTICDVVQDIKNAPDEMKELQLEVSRLRGLLGDFVQMDDADRPEQDRSWDALRLRPDLIEAARKLTEAANLFIEKTTKQKEDGTREVKKAKWPRHASEARELAGRFERLYVKISAVSSLETSAHVRSMGPQIVSAIDERIDHALERTITPAMERIIAEHEERMAKMLIRSLTIVSQGQREGCHQLFDELSILRSNPHPALGHSAEHLLVSLTDETAVPLVPPYSSANSTEKSDSCIQIMATSNPSHTAEIAFLSHPPPSLYSRLGPTRHRCPPSCKCHCHKHSSTRHLIPHALRSWFGDIRTHEGLLSSLVSSTRPCNDAACQQTRESLSVIKWLLPRWFAETEFKIRFQSLPVQFMIQTPRVVMSLRFLLDITFDELKLKLSTRELTVNDIEESGNSVLHYMAFKIIFQHDCAYDMMRYLLDAGAPHDWEYYGLTVTEYVADTNRYWFGSSDWSTTYFLYNVARPLLGEDMEDTWETIRAKRKWSDLHYLLANPPSSHALLKSELTRILGQPGAAYHLNAEDRFGRTPLYEAIRSCPSAVDALLRAGANPHLIDGVPFVDIAIAASSQAISPLVRAGEDVNKCCIWFDGHISTALHDIIRSWSELGTGRRLPSALELMRHAGHLLYWDIEDDLGWAPLFTAELLVKAYPDDEEAASIYELYKTRQIPLGAQLMDNSRLDEVTEITSELESLSLIKASLRGDVEAIAILIDAGAMVNERDESGRTLLHLVAMGAVPNAYAIVLELVRYGGYGVDWDALTVDAETAEDLANETLKLLVATEDDQLEETRSILRLLQDRALPEGIAYIYPCMHPKYCQRCSTVPCSGYCSNGLRMPGGFQ